MSDAKRSGIILHSLDVLSKLAALPDPDITLFSITECLLRAAISQIHE